MTMLRAILLSLTLLLSAWGAPASAEVVVTFWSHDRDQNYQHAFLVMRGRIDATGEAVDTNIGFTARRLTPGLLWGSVQGQMERLSDGYVARATSRPHFSVRLDDAGYARLQAFIARWAADRQPNYNLNRRNCIHFIMDAAATLGLSVNRRTGHLRDPKSFLEEVMRLNPGLEIARR